MSPTAVVLKFCLPFESPRGFLKVPMPKPH